MRAFRLFTISIVLSNSLFADKVDISLGKYAGIIGANKIIDNPESKEAKILLKYALCINPKDENVISTYRQIQNGENPEKIKSNVTLKRFLAISLSVMTL